MAIPWVAMSKQIIALMVGVSSVVYGLLLCTMIAIVLARRWNLDIVLVRYPSEPRRRSSLSETVIIEDSPLPTMTKSSPFPETPVPSRRICRAGRAGARRVCRHKRPMTMVYDPLSKGNCGIMVILKAANMKISAKSIAHMRTILAEKVREGFMHNQKAAGWDIREVVT